MRKSAIRISTLAGLGLIGLVGTVHASPPARVTPTNYATETIESSIKEGNDKVDLKTKGPTIVRAQLLSFGPNSTTGWHHHPGLVIVAVESGELQLWASDCSRKTYGPGTANGSVFIEASDHAHQATSTDGAQVRVTYIVPSTGEVTPANFRVEENVPFCATSL